MKRDIQPDCATSKLFAETTLTFLMLAILTCDDKSEQKTRILIAYEDGNFTPALTKLLIRTLNLSNA